jgi:RNA polymerase sigma factor (sigma-70 family)
LSENGSEIATGNELNRRELSHAEFCTEILISAQKAKGLPHQKWESPSIVGASSARCSVLLILPRCYEIEDDQRQTTCHQHARDVDRIMHNEHSVQIRSNDQTDTDKCCKQSPFQAGQRICPEPLSHGQSLCVKVGRIEAFFDHCHPLFVTVVVVDDQDCRDAAEKKDWDQKFRALHVVSFSLCRELMFVSGFGIFDLHRLKKVTVANRHESVTLVLFFRSNEMQDLAQENMHAADEDIVRRVLAGDKRAYGELVERHKDKAMTLALRMLKDRPEAEEALQDAFVRAFKALPRFEWKASFSTWLYRIVYNVCATSLSKRPDDVHLSLDDTGEQFLDVASDEPAPDALFERREFYDIVAGEIERMPETYAEILALFFVNDQSYEQIVEITGLPLATVKVRLFRGRILLRDAVSRRLGVTNPATL